MFKYLVYIDKTIKLFITLEEADDFIKTTLTQAKKNYYGIHTVYLYSIDDDGATTRIAYPLGGTHEQY